MADDAERSLLAEVLGAGFRAPDPRQGAPAFGARLRRLAVGAARLLGATLAFVRHPWRRPEVPERQLTAAERQFLSALRQQLGTQTDPLQPAMCEGQGPLRRRRRHRLPSLLLLPRDNRTVRACVRAYAADPSWMRLCHLALVSDGIV